MSKSRTIAKGEALAEHIMPMKYGDIVRHQDIEEIVEERRGDQRYYAAISKAKRILEENGKMIVRFGGGDYQVAYPGDYSKQYAREIRLANQRVKHGAEILRGAPIKDMTLEEVTTFNNVSDFHQRISASLSGSTVEVRKLVRKNPLRDAARDAAKK